MGCLALVGPGERADGVMMSGVHNSVKCQLKESQGTVR